jgi:hypothetical protein
MEVPMARILASASLASLFLATPAFAEEAKKDEKSIVPYGIIQAKYWLFDSTRATGTESDVEILRAGLRGSHGIAKGGIEVELMGNNKKPSDQSTASNGTVAVRAAWLGLALPTDTVLKLGRVRPGGAAGYGTDQTSTPQQYSGLDGARLIQKIALPGNGSVEVGIGAFNSLRGLWIEGGTTMSNMRNTEAGAAPAGSWSKPEKALLGSVVVKHSNITGQFWYGAEKNAIMKANYTVKSATSEATDTYALSGVEVANIAHIEASLGYDTDNWGAGVFVEQDIHGAHTNAALAAATGKLTAGAQTTTGDYTKDVTKTAYGFGGNLNSKEFGITNLVTQDDAITLGAAYVRIENRVEGTAVANQKGADVNELSASVGYSVNGLEFALGVANSNTSNKTFTNADGEAKHSSQRAYLNAAWEF